MKRLAALLLICILTALAAGCGGGGESAGSSAPTTTAPALGGIDTLLAEANRIERRLEERVKRLVELRSLSDLSDELGQAQLEVEQAAARFDALSVSSDLVEVRDALASALRQAATVLGHARGNVEALDLHDALEELRNLDLSAVEHAVTEIRRLAGGS